MRLEHFARLTKAGVKAGSAAVEGEPERATEHAFNGAIPAAADLLFGRGAGTLARVGIGMVQGIYQARQESALNVDARAHPGSACRLCRPYYSPAGEARLINHLDRIPSGVIFILGKRGQGKTALSMRIAERRGRETFVLGVPQRVLPDDWHSLDDHIHAGKKLDLLKMLPMGSSLIVDDAGLLLDSQEYQSDLNKAVKYLIMCCRHTDSLLVVNVQYASSITKYILDTDAFLLKAPPKMWDAIERPELHSLYEKITPFWRRLGEEGRKSHVWALSDVYEGPAHVRLPSFWTDDLSRNKGRAKGQTRPGRERILAA